MSILNKARFKKVALELAGKRHHKFTRISKEFVSCAEHALVGWMMNYINQLPSKGKTIK